MTRLNGLTKEAKMASGRSQKCDSCILRKERRCTQEIMRICHDSFVEGFKKGAKFCKEENTRIEKEAVAMFNEDFGMDLRTRLKKLAEEAGELRQAIVGYYSGMNGIWAIKDEMSDVLAVMTHVSSLLNTNPRNLFLESVDKITKRKENPNYKRTHPHIGD